MRVLRKLRKSQKTKCKENWWTPCMCLTSQRWKFGIKKKYGIFNESAQKVEKIAKNKVERVLVDTL